MMRALLITALAWIAAGAGAIAQEPPSAPTAEQVDAVRARAEQLLAAASAQDLFVAEFDEAVVKLRHGRSGLLCRFPLQDTAGRVTVVPSQALGIPRGDDISCGGPLGFGQITFFATRRTEPTSAEDELSNSVAAMRATLQSLRAVTPREHAEVPVPEGQTLPPSVSAAFEVRRDGNTYFTRISVAHMDGWTLKMRFSAPDERPNVLADIFWQLTLLDFAAHASHRQPVSPPSEQPTE